MQQNYYENSKILNIFKDKNIEVKFFKNMIELMRILIQDKHHEIVDQMNLMQIQVHLNLNKEALIYKEHKN